MKITTDVRRSDLLLFNLAYLPHNKAVVVGGPIGALVFFVVAVTTTDTPESGGWFVWFAFLLLSLAVGYGAMFAGILVSSVSMLLSSSMKNGVLGPHTFELNSDGIHEETPFNEGTHKWRGINDVRVHGRYLTVQISGSLFHLIPRHSFPSAQAFRDFASKSQEMWLSARR